MSTCCLGHWVGGRWSGLTRDFLRALARDRARSEPPLLRKRVERWWSVLSCTAARALASFVWVSGLMVTFLRRTGKLKWLEQVTLVQARLVGQDRCKAFWRLA